MSNKKDLGVHECILPHLEQIAERLWSGHATVMIGSGFSKNAGDAFPDWSQLGDMFYEKAYGYKPTPGKQKYLNVLKLAEEVEAIIGRPALEDLIRSNIPDLQYAPSKLHIDILDLPWVDVFTTNYDTLLERASSTVVRRRYDTVVNKKDIPYSTKPRIVKLHGSFPSERPFIITEEDYRRYPIDYAPFVNTVQQSLLENTFCLIGFSGDDPNFLQWIGWIRDNLGQHKSQKIYLVGVFDLSSAKKQLLEQRDIIIVDMSKCDGIGKHDHHKALEKFIKFIKERNPNALDWPFNNQYMTVKPDEDKIKQIQEICRDWKEKRLSYPGWLILPEGNRETLWVYTRIWVNYLSPDNNLPIGLDIKYAFELNWRLERCLLPVFTNLSKLFNHILSKYWPFHESDSRQHEICFADNKYKDLDWDEIRDMWLSLALSMLRFCREEGMQEERRDWDTRLNTLSKYLLPDQIAYLRYECVLVHLFMLDLPKVKENISNWIIDDSLPYWMAKRAALLAEIGQIEEAETILERTLAKIRIIGNLTPPSPNYSSVSEEVYAMLLFKYVHDAAQMFKINKSADIDEVSLIRSQVEHDWKLLKTNSYLDEQFKISSSKDNNIHIPFEISTPNNFVSDWDALYQGRDNERKKEWNARLNEIRNDKQKQLRQTFNERWNELKQYKCDPWNELDLFERSLDKEPVEIKRISESRGFDIGKTTRTHHLDPVDEDSLNAFTFFRFCEESGIPFRIGIYNLGKKSAELALPRVFKYSPCWAWATLARLGDSKAVGKIFSRESVYKFKKSGIDELIKRYLDALKNIRNDILTGNEIHGDVLAIRFAQVLPEAMSRLCCKCSFESKLLVLDFLSELYSSNGKNKYREIGHLIQRLIASFSASEQFTIIPKLISIKYPTDLNPLTIQEFLNPFRLLGIDENSPCANEKPAIPKKRVSELLVQSASGDENERRWATFTLVKLYKLNLLDEEQLNLLGESLWSKCDNCGLPSSTDFYRFGFLSFPHPSIIDPIPIFKKYVKDTPFPIQKHHKEQGVSLTGGNIALLHDIIGANESGIWNSDDIIEFLNRLVEWWDADKERLKKEEKETPFGSIYDEFMARLSSISELIAEVIGPRSMPTIPDKSKSDIARLLSEMSEHDIPTLQAESACLHIFPESKDGLFDRISNTLLSNSKAKIDDALKALASIILKNINIINISQALSLLANYVLWRRTPSLPRAIYIVARILNSKPAIFESHFEADVLKAIQILAAETDYSNEETELSFDEKLEIRKAAATLAYRLNVFYTDKKIAIPKPVEEWYRICHSDNEFAEIKNEWIS